MALQSEIKGWHWVITYDNPLPPNSSTMIAALGRLGKLTRVQTKTTYVLAPKRNVGWQRVRQAIESCLHPQKGNAVYVNLRTGRAFEYGRVTGYSWRRVT